MKEHRLAKHDTVQSTQLQVQWLSELGEYFLAAMERAMRRAFDRERELLTKALQQELRDSGDVTQLGRSVASLEDDQQWIGIESLSRLRGLVGGRFQQLKARWVDAGLPLRAHRGDRTGKVQIDRDAWLELAAWIERQGYEARLAADGSEYLFEVREISKA
ncbi:MAG: hypothetical protein QY326_06750 [Bdellovibrionota bacterium]|nr:MAG: hypothetical protein QY326_06750 [Bdellovibrionota bacterium]